MGVSVSFNAWLIKVIAAVLEKYPEAAAYVRNKRS
jgi:hypothetical protein